jgi:hypothetical protein
MPAFLLWASSSTVETVDPMVLKICLIKEQKIRDYFRVPCNIVEEIVSTVELLAYNIGTLAHNLISYHTYKFGKIKFDYIIMGMNG